MFGLSWTEVVLIGVVAMVLIGPKDLPIAVRAVADVVKKARRMAGEFQTHVDEMMKDANLKEVRDSISEIRRMDIVGDIRRHVDADGSLGAALTEDPFRPAPGPTAAPSIAPSITEAPSTQAEGSLSITPAAPAFIPPSGAAAGVADAAPGVAAPVPAFIPPSFVPAAPAADANPAPAQAH